MNIPLFIYCVEHVFNKNYQKNQDIKEAIYSWECYMKVVIKKLHDFFCLRKLNDFNIPCDFELIIFFSTVQGEAFPMDLKGSYLQKHSRRKSRKVVMGLILISFHDIMRFFQIVMNKEMLRKFKNSVILRISERMFYIQTFSFTMQW